MKQKYSMETDKENSSRALGSSLNISRKQGIEISNYLRGKNVSRAKVILEAVIAKKDVIPFKRFKEGAGHKKGKVGPGKYPVKACTELLKLLKSAESNAQFKGLNTESLFIRHISCQQAPSSPKGGRHRGRMSKRSHVEIILEEKEKSKTEKKPQPKKEAKPVKKETEKTETKKEVPKEISKEEPSPKKSEQPNKEEKKEEEKEAVKETDNNKDNKTEEPKEEVKKEDNKEKDVPKEKVKND